MKKQTLKKLFYAITASVLIFNIQACKENEPEPDKPPVNENELITTVQLIFTDSADNSVSSFLFKDPDGDGGNNPTVFDTILLKSDRTYFTQILLLDESKTKTDTISNEVLEEAEDHLFVFTPSWNGLNIRLTDLDSKGLPLGLLSTWKTGIPGNGRVKVALKHQPGLKDGSPAPGETDVEIAFICRIE